MCAVEDMFKPVWRIIGGVDGRSGDFLEEIYRKFLIRGCLYVLVWFYEV
jgi:UDP-glucose 6-dehydrogenase